jgi:hypothetical protein
MAKKVIKFTPSVYDESWDIDVSPSKLPEYAGEGPLLEVDQAFETILKQPPPAEFYKAVATLVFHSRHLKPHQHAQVASWLVVPYKRRAGKPINYDMRECIELWLLTQDLHILGAAEVRKEFVGRIAQKFKTNPAFVRRVIQQIKSKKNGT